MQFTDVAQLSTQAHAPTRYLQARSQGFGVEDAAAGVARPARPRKKGGRRHSCGCHHASHQGGPRGGSSAHLDRPSDVGVVVAPAVPIH